MKFIIVLLLFLIAGCKTSETKNDYRNLDFNYFTIESPRSWTKIKLRGIDSYVGKIAIDNSDTLYFDLGWYSNKLEGKKSEIISWDTIDGRRCKIVYPSKAGVGITGIYIDSLWQAGSEIDRFNLAGYNLKPENEKLLLQALQTLKFYNKE